MRVVALEQNQENDRLLQVVRRKISDQRRSITPHCYTTNLIVKKTERKWGRLHGECQTPVKPKVI